MMGASPTTFWSSFLRFILLSISLSLLFIDVLATQRSRCAVKDSTKIHPELARVPPAGFSFMSSTDSQLMSRMRSQGDKDALNAFFNKEFKCEEKYIIPVAWHVIYSTSGEGKVEKDALEKQVQVLNDAFVRTPLIFNMSSVDYTENDAWTKSCLPMSSAFMRALAHYPSSTLNLYTCKFSDSAGTIGDAAMPWWYEENSKYHGVVLHPDTLPGGSYAPINEGKNAVHEVGHYFGLFHVSEGGCDNMDDGVRDTPRNKPSYGCPPTDTDTCPEQPGNDPVRNYMGFTNDACMTEFTSGQIERMKWALEKYRPTLMKMVQKPCTIDALFRWSNGYVYLFSGSNYYRYNESRPGLDPGYPRSISDHWPGVPSDVDGVFRYGNGITYFFKGKHYFRYNDTSSRVDPGFPRLISEFWRGVPSDIDDVISSANGYMYFFKGSQYYRFNPKTGHVDVGYPKAISEYWVNVPRDIEAAISWYNGGVYFFKDTQYWFFLHGDRTLGVPRGYPKPVREWWQGTMGLSGYTLFRHCNGYTYFFQRDLYWRFNDNLYHVDFQYPKPITSSWTGLPTNVDTGFMWSNKRMYFFKGNEYFRFNVTAGQLDHGYPKPIGEFWNGVPHDLDAVFRYVNGITYFFKGSDYYRFNDTTFNIDAGYPRPITSFWKGVPNHIDSVFVWSNGHTYFFKGNLYYRFNCETKQVDQGYPKSISRWRGILYQP